MSSSSTNISKVVGDILNQLNIKSCRRWSGAEFFELTRSDVMAAINSELTKDLGSDSSIKKQNTELSKVLTSITNTSHRNAGKTSNLCGKSQKHRNELIHELVNFVSAGEVKGNPIFDSEILSVCLSIFL